MELPSTTYESRCALLESHGYQVGFNLVTLLSLTDSSSPQKTPQLDQSPLPGLINLDPRNSLSVIKYICKDLWSKCFQKQITKLQTNHKGIFVLKDDSFSLLANLPNSASKDADVQALATLTLAYPCGLIRGALKAFGMQANVTADFFTDKASLKCTTFHVKISQGDNSR